MGYAIWLVPSSTEFMALSELMKFRPQPHILNPYSRSYPSFDPHITLATFDYLPSSFNLEAIPLKGLQRPVTTFGSMRCGSSYLGALSVRMADSRQFRRVHEAVVTYLSALGMHWRSHDFPHMSLFYVDEPVERKRLDAQLVNSGRVQRYDAGRGLVLDPYPNSARSIPVTTFTGEEIWLVDCTSHSVNHWRVMRRRFLVSPILPPAPKSILKNPSSARPSSLHRTRSNRVNRGAKSSRRRRQASSFNRCSVGNGGDRRGVDMDDRRLFIQQHQHVPSSRLLLLLTVDMYRIPCGSVPNSDQRPLSAAEEAIVTE